MSRGRPVWPWAVGGTLLLLLAAGLVTYVSEYGLTLPVGRPAQDPPAPTAVDDGSEPGAGLTVPGQRAETAPDATVASGAAEGPDAPFASSSQDAGVPVVPPGHVSVSLAFAADSWAEIYDGSGQTVLYDLGRAGTERKIAAAAPLSVTIGNSAGVTLVVNGRAAPLPLPPAGQSVARFTIAADGSLRRAGG